MESKPATSAFAALAHPDRLAVVRLLARRAPGGVRPAELIAALGLKPNTLSNHLATLTAAGLVEGERRGRRVEYRLQLDRLGALVAHLVSDCCGGRPEACAPLAARQLVSLEKGRPMPDRPPGVLFICTGNSARSIMAEALLRDIGAGRFRAFSAGTRPAKMINPHARALLEEAGHDTSALGPKDLAGFEGPGAPRVDFVFTVCDRAALEPCPVWPGRTASAHWPVPDPAAVDGSEAEVRAAFHGAYATLRRRIERFCALPLDRLDPVRLQQELDRIGSDMDERAERAAS